MTRTLVPIVIAALTVRLFVLFSGTTMGVDVVMTYSTYDSNRYVVLAEELLAGHGFARPYEEGPVHLAVLELRKRNGTMIAERDAYTPEGFRTPGYPAYLAVFGGHAGLEAAIFVQCVLGSLSAALAALVAFKIGLTKQAAMIVGWLWALHPALVTTDLLVLTESLFTTIGLAALAAALFIRGPWGFLVAGVLIGIDGLVRPLGLFYLPAVLILAPLPRRSWLTILVTLLLAIAPSLWWANRNAEAGYGNRVSTVSEINLYYYGAAYTLSESRGHDWKKQWPATIRELSELKLEPGEDVQTAMRRESLRIYREHPKDTLKVAAKSETKLMLDHSMEYFLAQYRLEFESSGLFSDLLNGQLNLRRLKFPQVASMLWMALNAVIALLTLIGLFLFLRRRQWRLFFGCAIPIVLFSLATFPVGLERFRVPFMLFLFVPAANALRSAKPPRRG